MKKVSVLLLSLLFITCQSYAVDTSKVEVRGTINDGTAVVEDTNDIVKVFTSGTRQMQTVSLTAGVNTLTVPTSAKAVILDVQSVKSLHVMGRAGDQGISLDSTTPVVLPISSDGTVATIIISNDNATTQSIRVSWF